MNRCPGRGVYAEDTGLQTRSSGFTIASCLPRTRTAITRYESRSRVQPPSHVTSQSSKREPIVARVRRRRNLVSSSMAVDRCCGQQSHGSGRTAKSSRTRKVSAVADSEEVSVLKGLSQRILTRDILPHFAVEVGKSELLRETLLHEGFAEGREFNLLDLKTTMYKGDSDEGVFVLD